MSGRMGRGIAVLAGLRPPAAVPAPSSPVAGLARPLVVFAEHGVCDGPGHESRVITDGRLGFVDGGVFDVLLGRDGVEVYAACGHPVTAGLLEEDDVVPCSEPVSWSLASPTPSWTSHAATIDLLLRYGRPVVY